MKPLAKLFQKSGQEPTCEKVNRFLAEYLDGNLSPETEESFRAHLGKCPACITFFDQYKLTIDLVRSEKEVDVPERLVEHTLEFLREHLDPGESGQGATPD